MLGHSTLVSSLYDADQTKAAMVCYFMVELLHSTGLSDEFALGDFFILQLVLP